MDALGLLGGGDPLVGLAILGATAAVVKTAGATLGGFAEARIAGEVGAEVRREVLDRVLAVDGLRAPRHGDHGDGSLDAGRHDGDELASLTTHVLEVERGVAHGVVGEVRGVVQLLPLAGLLLLLAPRLAGTAVLAMATFAVLVMGTRRALKRAHTRAAKDAAELLSASDEAVRHADLWKTYGATAKIRHHLGTVSSRIVAAQARLRAHGALVSGTSEVLGALALVLVLVLAGAGVLGGVEKGTLLPFSVAFFMAYKPLREVVEARLARARGEASLEAALAGEEGAPIRIESAPATGAWPLAELVLEGVVGRFGRHAPLSLRIAPGAVVAIVGPTGVGKSSLVRALLGLDAPRAGRITYAGVALEDQGTGPSARPFAWVPQDAPVLAASLAENVVLGRADDDASAAERCLARLGAHALARSLDDELVVARALSGGEKQIVALARALATELPVLVLDEPTSALDPQAQAEVLAALAALRGERTLIVVTHRPEPLALADVVVRLEEGSAPLGHDADDRTRLDEDVVLPDEVAVRDPGAGPRRKTHPEA